MSDTRVNRVILTTASSGKGLWSMMRSSWPMAVVPAAKYHWGEASVEQRAAAVPRSFLLERLRDRPA
jgi:hypothetical protein